MGSNCSNTPGRCQIVQHPDRSDELFCTTCKKRLHVTEEHHFGWTEPTPFQSKEPSEETPSFGPLLFAVLMAVVVFSGLSGDNLRQKLDLRPAEPAVPAETVAPVG